MNNPFFPYLVGVFHEINYPELLYYILGTNGLLPEKKKNKK